MDGENTEERWTSLHLIHKLYNYNILYTVVPYAKMKHKVKHTLSQAELNEMEVQSDSKQQKG